jgi:hypothetical protein
MTVSAHPLTHEERHARFVLELLDDPGGQGGPALDAPDWPLLARLAQRHAVLIRVADRLADLGVPLPRDFVASAERERERSRATLDVLRHVQANSIRHRVAWMAPKVPQRYPDVGDDLDLLVFTPDLGVDRLLLDGIPVTGERASLANRLSGSTVYTVVGVIAPGLVIDIHHGRVGPAGQHVAFARALQSGGQRQVLGGGGPELCVPAPEDQLVLQGLEKVAGRRSFHLCDVLQTVAILRRARLDWDRVVTTARAHGGWDGLSCYLYYVDEVYARLVGWRLLAPEQRHTLTLRGWGHATLHETGFRFPALRVTGRLHGSQLGRSLGQAQWNTALRLSLWPFAVVGTRLAQARTW